MSSSANEKGDVNRAVLEIRSSNGSSCSRQSASRNDIRLCVLTVLHATERNSPKGRKTIEWKLITDLPVRSRQEAIEKIDWYASDGRGSERIRGERRELNTSVSVSESVSASVSVERFAPTQKTEDRRQQQEQEQRQNQGLGGITPEPPEKEHPVPSSCLELERVWKGVTKAPCYPRNFIPLLAAYPVDHIAAVISWTFKTSNYWNIKNSGHFCKRVNGTFTVFAHLSAQYESFMAKVREGEAEQAQQPSPAPATLAGPAQSTNYEEPEELDEFIPPSVLQQPSPQLNKLKGSSPYNDRFPKDAFRKSAVSAPALVEEDSYISPKRCVAVWKGKCPGRPCDEGDFDYLLDHFDEGDILFAIRHFQDYEWWSEEIKNSGDFSDNFSEILAEVEPVEPHRPMKRNSDGLASRSVNAGAPTKPT